KVWAASIERGRAQIERALQLYGGLVDLYQVHNLVGWRDYLPILRNLKSSGRVKAIGITHYSHGAFPEIRSIMETEEIDAIQIPWPASRRSLARKSAIVLFGWQAGGPDHMTGNVCGKRTAEGERVTRDLEECLERPPASLSLCQWA